MAATHVLGVTVEVEEEVYRYTPADNGSGPFWCYGSTCIVRIGEDLYVTGLETLPWVEPSSYNNVRWLLFRRDAKGWALQQAGDGRTREPAPLGVTTDGRLLLSDNPTLAPPNTRPPCPSQPQLLAFSAENPRQPYRVLLPAWQGDPAFTEHSYRGLAVDGEGGEALLMNILGHECYHWALLDAKEQWVASGRLGFPWGAEYEVPEAIRLCYPQIILSGRAAHVLAISDIVEPVSAWKAARYEVTGRTWDYDFRRLFYTFTPDITSVPFAPWTEVASRERTAGAIRNLDLWQAPDGDVHLLWLEQSCDPRIRERFFPDEELVMSLEHQVLREGAAVRRQTLVRASADAGERVPLWGRFHPLPDGRLHVYYAMGTNRGQYAEVGEPITNHLMALSPNGGVPGSVLVALQQPLRGGFMTATPRAGTRPSHSLDLLGVGSDPHVVRYVRVRVD